MKTGRGDASRGRQVAPAHRRSRVSGYGRGRPGPCETGTSRALFLDRRCLPLVDASVPSTRSRETANPQCHPFSVHRVAGQVPVPSGWELTSGCRGRQPNQGQASPDPCKRPAPPLARGRSDHQPRLQVWAWLGALSLNFKAKSRRCRPRRALAVRTFCTDGRGCSGGLAVHLRETWLVKPSFPPFI